MISPKINPMSALAEERMFAQRALGVVAETGTRRVCNPISALAEEKIFAQNAGKTFVLPSREEFFARARKLLSGK